MSGSAVPMSDPAMPLSGGAVPLSRAAVLLPRVAVPLSRKAAPSFHHTTNREVGMARYTREMAKRVDDVAGAWERMRRQKSFFGMKFDEFRQAILPFVQARAAVLDLQKQLQHALVKRQTTGNDAMRATKGVVSAVKGDPEEGEEGELYSAMGYVPASRRGAGLKRKRKKATPKESTR